MQSPVQLWCSCEAQCSSRSTHPSFMRRAPTKCLLKDPHKCILTKSQQCPHWKKNYYFFGRNNLGFTSSKGPCWLTKSKKLKKCSTSRQEPAGVSTRERLSTRSVLGYAQLRWEEYRIPDGRLPEAMFWLYQTHPNSCRLCSS